MKYFICFVISVVIIGVIYMMKKKLSVNSEKEINNTVETDVEYNIKKLVELLFNETRDDVSNTVLLAYKQPVKFYNDNKQIFADFYFDEIKEIDYIDTSLIVLYSHLSKEIRACNLDWSQDNNDTLYFINELLEARKTKKITKVKELTSSSRSEMVVLADHLNCNNDNYLGTYEFLCHCGRELEKEELILCELGRGNDAYEVFIVDKVKFNEVKEINKRLGYSITQITN